jgi:peptidoglycan/LPS O-acetylase OafA/YrhL
MVYVLDRRPYPALDDMDANLSPLLKSKLSGEKLPSLDGLRAIAVTIVILYHFGVPGVEGLHGVIIFFVLSGFLITWLLLKEDQRTGHVSAKNFYMRRALRILPAFYVFWVIHLGFYSIFRGAPNIKEYVYALFYVTNYALIMKGSEVAIVHTWSLSIEEQFYLIWPWIFIAFSKDLRKLTKVLIGLIVFSWAWRNLLYFQFHVPYLYLSGAFECRMDSLFTGSLLAVLLKRGRLNEFAEKVTISSAAPLITLALLYSSIYTGYIYKSLTWIMVLGTSFENTLIAIFILQMMLLGDRPVWRLLNTAPMRYCGSISYAMYLYHGIAANVAGKLIHSSLLGVRVVSAIGTNVVISTLSFQLVEKRFLRLKTRFQSQSSVAPELQKSVAAGPT